MKAHRAKFVLFILLVPATTCAADLQTVISALRAQDFEHALVLAKELSAEDAADPRIWTLEGMANEGLQNRTEALRNYRSALKLKPDYLPAMKAEAQLEYQAGDPNAAKTLERIVRLDSADQVSHAMLAALAYKNGNCKSAAAQYSQSLNVIGEKADALTQYGDCLLKTEKPGEAAAVLAQVVALEPGEWWPRYNLAAAEMSRRQAAQAMKTIESILTAPSVEPQVLDLAAQASESLSDTPKAVELLRRAILLQPDNETYYLHFTDLCFDHSSFQVGVDMLNAGLTRLPKSARLYLARGILWGQLGDFSKAESDFNQADRLSADGAISGAAASLVELQNSRLESALQVARVRLRSNPADPMLHYVKAETLKQMGVGPGTAEFREALNAAETAVRLKPDFAAARNLLGSLYMQENRLEPANGEFRAVLQADPQDTTALYHLIQLSRKMGRNEHVPALVKQLAESKIASQKKEADQGRYRLVEPPSPGSSHAVEGELRK